MGRAAEISVEGEFQWASARTIAGLRLSGNRERGERCVQKQSNSQLPQDSAPWVQGRHAVCTDPGLSLCSARHMGGPGQPEMDKQPFATGAQVHTIGIHSNHSGRDGEICCADAEISVRARGGLWATGLPRLGSGGAEAQQWNVFFNQSSQAEFSTIIKIDV